MAHLDSSGSVYKNASPFDPAGLSSPSFPLSAMHVFPSCMKEISTKRIILWIPLNFSRKNVSDLVCPLVVLKGYRITKIESCSSRLCAIPSNQDRCQASCCLCASRQIPREWSAEEKERLFTVGAVEKQAHNRRDTDISTLNTLTFHRNEHGFVAVRFAAAVHVFLRHLRGASRRWVQREHGQHAEQCYSHDSWRVVYCRVHCLTNCCSPSAECLCQNACDYTILLKSVETSWLNLHRSCSPYLSTKAVLPIRWSHLIWSPQPQKLTDSSPLLLFNVCNRCFGQKRQVIVVFVCLFTGTTFVRREFQSSRHSALRHFLSPAAVLGCETLVVKCTLCTVNLVQPHKKFMVKHVS